MAFNSGKNLTYFQRKKNWCAAMMNLYEEAKRLQALRAVEVAPGGSENAAYVDVPSIATKAEANALDGIQGEFVTFMAGGGTLGSSVRSDFMVPFVDEVPA